MTKTKSQWLADVAKYKEMRELHHTLYTTNMRLAVLSDDSNMSQQYIGLASLQLKNVDRLDNALNLASAFCTSQGWM